MELLAVLITLLFVMIPFTLVGVVITLVVLKTRRAGANHRNRWAAGGVGATGATYYHGDSGPNVPDAGYFIPGYFDPGGGSESHHHGSHHHDSSHHGSAHCGGGTSNCGGGGSSCGGGGSSCGGGGSS